jgi:TrfA protein
MFSIQNLAPMPTHEATPSDDGKEDFGDWPAYELPVCKSHLQAAAPEAPMQLAPTPNGLQSTAQPSAAAPSPFPYSNKPNHFPAFFARSGLFSVARHEDDASSNIVKMIIKAQAPYSIVLEGERLNMSDKRVFEAVVRLAKACTHDINSPMRCSLRGIAIAMGWKNVSGTSTKWIWESLVRLSLARIEFRLDDQIQRSGKLLESVSKASSGLFVSFDPDFVVPAFGVDLQFAIDTERRERLATPIAKWLHDFVSTHTAAYPFTVEHLREMTGYDARAKSFPAALGSATAAICSACPELAASFPVGGSTKCSDKWTAMYTPGPESANFFDPTGKKAFPPAAAAKPHHKGLPPPPATRPRRGGVAL